tara:strand:- start:6551 stop:7441 length:891 start_codon:yes stop_codon:yes gene_type:complete
MEFNDGTKGKYNVGHERAEKYYNKHIEYFNTFDVIITSDTAPISRVFLQNKWDKKLIIWINNRFDYCDEATNDCNFPDEEYYTLFREAINKDNIEIIGYTPFENFYCKNIRNIDIGNKVIKPIGCNSYIYDNMNMTKIKDKSNTFFVGSYHNDNIMINLCQELSKYNINCYKGRFNGPKDLAEYKGVIHIPYSWSNYSLFEGIQNGIIYFIPSKEFFMELKKDKNFFWSPPYRDENLEISEWYNDVNKDCFIYFDSWDDLKVKTLTINYGNMKAYLKEFGNKHKNDMIKLWKEVLF